MIIKPCACSYSIFDILVANVLESSGNLRFKGFHMNHDYQPTENESTGGRPGYKIRVRPDKSSAMLTGDPHNPSNLGEWK